MLNYKRQPNESVTIDIRPILRQALLLGEEDRKKALELLEASEGKPVPENLRIRVVNVHEEKVRMGFEAPAKVVVGKSEQLKISRESDRSGQVPQLCELLQ